MPKPEEMRNNLAIRPVMKEFTKFKDSKLTIKVKPPLDFNEMNGILMTLERKEDYASALNPDKIFQEPVRIIEPPMFHIQDRVNPYHQQKNPDYFKRLIAMREGRSHNFNFTVLPCGVYY